jgi:hypothetical protein|tara:strand:- start:891 stop:1331 length:441 start_codon:yes stop_codon:yes gene_type:complete
MNTQYPRQKCNGVWKEYADTCEEEEQITKDYFKANPPRSLEAVIKFIREFDGDNEIVDVFKRSVQPRAVALPLLLAYWGYNELQKEPMNKEKVISIGKRLNQRGGKGLMMMSWYLLCWDIKCGGTLVGSYTRLVELWWDGIGDWMG